jgi:hypothetical protein
VVLDNDSLHLEDATANLDFMVSENECNSEDDVACWFSSGSRADTCLGEDEPRALWSAPTAGMVVKEKDGGGAS